MEYYSVIKNKESLPFGTIWMELEGIKLSEINQRKTNQAWYPFYIESPQKSSS